MILQLETFQFTLSSSPKNNFENKLSRSNLPSNDWHKDDADVEVKSNKP